MNKNTTSHTLIQNFFSEAELQAILMEFNHTDTARKCTVSTVISYLISAATNEWKSLRHAADVGPSVGLISVDHSSLSKHMKALDYAIMKRIFEVIVGKLNRATRRTLKMPRTLLSIDSTTITVGKTRLPWAVYHGERSGIKLHVSFTNETVMPLQIVETTGLKHDGPIGVSLEDKRFILVCDRAYFSIDKVDRYVTEKEKQHFVIRLKDNVQLNRKKSLKGTRPTDSNVKAGFTCTIGTPQKQTKKRHRVVQFTDYEGKDMRVVTSLMNVTAEEIAAMYKSRWAIESFFHWIKQNLNVPVLFGTTSNAVFNQLFAAMIAYILLKFLHVKGSKKKHIKPLSFAGFTRLFLCDTLPFDWRIYLTEILAFHRQINQINTV
ncbi:IS4 family transposase [Bacillus thuringiensis]|uniref:IS4 family transposase n=1 Tax=Bacillus thuringiensis TaxID=1428 RepID=A0ABD6SDY5_BACTU|nr:IS4 family transposase [Bacillus thuringiensis]PEQ45794.1 IS4 family transposase [Bacillus thuringiensis]PER53279.1 IS4 family transposase [Bacillus thuringiensis]PEU97093.1 IS4 family transposase [Bacillus thuringiensis]PFI08385.1 IS4 family transposase [Bacillus thuringiensis]PFW43291.1 IS4 family transposase [Bacillus thuringiensis]